MSTQVAASTHGLTKVYGRGEASVAASSSVSVRSASSSRCDGTAVAGSLTIGVSVPS